MNICKFNFYYLLDNIYERQLPLCAHTLRELQQHLYELMSVDMTWFRQHLIEIIFRKLCISIESFKMFEQMFIQINTLYGGIRGLLTLYKSVDVYHYWKLLSQ